MITAAEYLKRVTLAAQASDGNEYHTVAHAIDQLGSVNWDIERSMMDLEAKRDLYDAVPGEHSMFLKIPGWALFFELGEAKAAIENDDLMDSWVYDRQTGIVILNINRGAHENFTADLFQLYTKEPLGFKTMKESERDAERFIEDGFGFVLSSRARRPLKGANIKLSAQEKMVFAKQDFRILS